jgi:UDP-N-acetylmuramate: L-alanyl-gamma-D-glutamyl-meso-diaminopimelate ligase
MDLTNVRKIYFIGIGGIGMSAAAGIAAEAGYEVAGSDSKAIYDPAKSVLDKFMIDYHIGYDAHQAEEAAADLYIASAGEDRANPEIKYLSEKDIPFYSFSELLYELNKDRIRIVVAGTHGKSTTAGLIGHILYNLDDSSFMTGAVLQYYQTNFEYGSGHYAVFEGDEYKALYNDPTPKFHLYKPDVLVLTNLEFDHPDLFENLDQLKYEVSELIANLPDDGLVIYNADDANLVQLVHQTNVASYGFGVHNPSDYRAVDLEFRAEATDFMVLRESQGERVWQEQYETKLPGEINVYNALAGVALLRSLGFKREQIQEQLLTYEGVKRRLELIGQTKSGIIIYDDYAHHPTEVRETLAAARTRYPGKTIWAVFEPHTYSRTQATLADLVKSFGAADQVLLAEIYPAREQKTADSITGTEVVAAFDKAGQKNVRLVADKAEAFRLLQESAQPGDVVIIMAVGSFNTLAGELRDKL